MSSSDLEATFSLLSRTSYSWEDLQQRPLPYGVDPARIEAYLDTLAFQVNSAHCGGGIFVKSKMEADRDEERSWALLTLQPIPTHHSHHIPFSACLRQARSADNL